MRDLQVFNFEELPVRTLTVNEEPCFVGKDVADILGYKRTADAIREHVDAEDKGVGKIQTPGGMQNVTLINESGLYSLIFSSKLESAKRFKRYIRSFTDFKKDWNLPSAKRSNASTQVDESDGTN